MANTYWQDREAKHILEILHRHQNYEKEIHQIYNDLWSEIQEEVEKFYSVYAGKEKISITEAKKRVSLHDVEAFAEKAAKYVKDRDFSSEANKQLRLYNLTMRVNRLELLKSKIGLYLTGTTDKIQKYIDLNLTAEALAEFRRQAGILGETVMSQEHYGRVTKSLVQASYKGVTFSQRLWANQDVLKSNLNRLLVKSIIAGKHPDVVSRELRQLVVIDKLRGKETADYVARRLMLSESTRIQTDVQKRSYEDAKIEEYDFICENDACSHCWAIANEGPYKTKDMAAGVNASPIHGWCRCSTTPRHNNLEIKIADSAKGRQQLSNRQPEYKPVDWSKTMQGVTEKMSNILNNIHQQSLDATYEKQKELMSLSSVSSEALLLQRLGEIDQVIFDEEIKRLLKNAAPNSVILTHNHFGYGGSTFSRADLLSMISFKSFKSYTLQMADGSVYLMDMNNQNLNLIKRIQFTNRLDKIYTELERSYQDLPNRDELWGELVNKANMQIAKEFGFTYRRIE